MTSNELRVGNFISQHTYRNGVCNEIRKVAAVNQEGFLSINVGDRATLKSHPIKWFSPIPLTDDWLLKFGFVQTNKITFTLEFKNGQVIQLHESDCALYGPDACTSGQSFSFKMEYVHHLQNLYFALTGEELTQTS